jgi:hypothetical protein
MAVRVYAELNILYSDIEKLELSAKVKYVKQTSTKSFGSEGMH